MVAAAVDLHTQEDRVQEDLAVAVVAVLFTHLVLSQQVVQTSHLLLVSLLLMDREILVNQETLVVVAELVPLVVLASVKTLVVLVSQQTLLVLQFLLVEVEEVKHNIQTLVLLLVQVAVEVAKALKVNLAAVV
tara:strand:+ start:174 stop:572 length:399 start_codon:yes stop_codon:yes gene_type:complete